MGGGGGGGGGLHGKDGKGESEKGCVPSVQQLYKTTTWATLNILFSLHFEKPYIKRSLYSLYVQEGAPPLRGQSGRGWTMISLHMHA